MTRTQIFQNFKHEKEFQVLKCFVNKNQTPNNEIINYIKF